MSNQKGQVLLFVIVIMTVSLSIAIAVSTRTLASLSRVTREDTANKALTAAESGLEQYLLKTPTELNALMSADTTLSFVDSNSGIRTAATMNVQKYKFNFATNILKFNLDTGYVKEIKLDGFTGASVKICWDNTATAIAYTLYSPSTIISKGIIDPYVGISATKIYNDSTQGSTASGPTSEYPAGCKSITGTSGTSGLRIRTLYNNANVYVIPSTGTLPDQGYKITATGKLFSEGKVTTTKKITVYKSYPYVSGIFDYALYTETPLNN